MSIANGETNICSCVVLNLSQKLKLQLTFAHDCVSRAIQVSSILSKPISSKSWSIYKLAEICNVKMTRLILECCQ